MEHALESSLLPAPTGLRLKDTRLVFLKFSGAASFGRDFGDQLFDKAERNEIEAIATETRRQERIAVMVAVKMVAQSATRQWFGVELPLSLLQVVSAGPRVRVSAPTHPQLDAMLSLLGFSVSHSGTLIAAAASHRKVGIGIAQVAQRTAEAMQPVAPHERYCNLSQCVATATASGESGLSASSPMAEVAAFTRKEAVLKAAGIGPGEGPDDVVLKPMRPGNVRLATHRGIAYEVVSVLDGGYSMALACTVEAPLPLPDPIPESLPVIPSFGQEALYMLEHLEGVGSAFALAWRERLLGQLDEGAAGRALQYLVNRHDSLRWRFGEQGGRIVARVACAPIITPRLIDLTHLTYQEAIRRVHGLGLEAVEQRFDLVAGPLLRCWLIRISATESVLIFCFHHSIMDGASVLPFRWEFAAAYNAFAAGKPPGLPPPPFRYADFARRQREALTAERLEKLWVYWREVMADCPTSLTLGPARQVNEKRSYESRQLEFTIRPPLRSRLQEAARAEGVTQFVIALAAFQILLMEISGEDDFAVGVPFAGREQSGEFAVIGYFVNVLPVRSGLVGSATVRDVLQRLREAVIGAIEHQDLPLADLVKGLNPPGRTVHAPLFQSVFRFGNEYPVGIELKGLTQEYSHLPPRATLYELNLALSLGTAEGHGLLECNAASFDRESALRAVGRYQELLAAVAEHPERELKNVAKGLFHEHDADRESWNDTERDIPHLRVEELFAAQAERSPDAVAVQTGDEALTYAELNARANRLANYLSKLGVRPGDFVGVSMRRTPDLVVALLAVLKTGAAYVPLDSRNPPERLAVMAQDSALRAIVSHQDHLALIPATGARVVCLDRDRDDIGRESATLSDRSRNAAATEPAYVMYTSGSTGKPKGVATPHIGIVRLLFGVDYVQLDRQQVLLQLGPLGFDASTFEIWGALLHGGRCVLFPDSAPTAATLGSCLHEHRVTTCFLTTALFNVIIDEAPEILREVRQLLFGGEKVSVSHVRRALKALPGTRLIHCYGPTEATTFSTTYAVPEAVPEKTTAIPIGKPIANTSVHLLDERQAPVRIGKVGEIYIGGIGLANGYLNQPELTAEKFVADPFDTRPNARLYKTGDLARRLPDGNIEFVGRVDNQVKVRGFRIELEEIEDSLKSHPAVMEAAVVPVENARHQTRLVAYVRLRGRGKGPIPKLRAHLRARLPSFSVPDVIMDLPKLPRNENNKIDRAALARLPTRINYERQGFHQPRDATDYLLMQIWQDLLGAPVGIDDDFFEIGGNSLLAVSLLARIEQHTGRTLPLATLFSRTTIRALVEALIGDAAQDPESNLVELHKGSGGRPLFFFHGDFTGGGFFSKPIAKAANLDGPFVVVQPQGLSRNQQLPDSIQAMAAAHLRAIKARQRQGPYRLAGYCNGALIALEIAQQLLTDGKKVEFLGMIDPSPPFAYPAQHFDKESTARFLSKHAASPQLARLLTEDVEHRAEVLNHYSRLCAGYKAEPYPGTITLILIEKDRRNPDFIGAWKAVAGKAIVYQFQKAQATHAFAPLQNAGWIGKVLRHALAGPGKTAGFQSDQAELNK